MIMDRSVSTNEPIQASATDSDFIDLGREARYIYSRWRLVLFFVVLGAVIGAVLWFGFGRLYPRYTTEAQILLTGSKYQISFDPRFTTVEGLPNLQISQQPTRAEEYLAILDSLEIRDAAKSLLRGKYPDEDIDSIAISPQVRSALVTIRTQGRNMDAVQAMADAYAVTAAARFDTIYGQSDINLSMLQTELADARTRQDKAEADLRAFLAQSQIDALKLQIDQKSTLRVRLSQQTATETNIRLATYYAAMAELDSLGRDARALRQQIETSGATSASTLANSVSLLSLQARVNSLSTVRVESTETSPPDSLPSGQTQRPDEVARSTVISSDPSRLPVTITLDVGTLNANASRTQLLSDLDAVIAVVEARTTDVRTAIETTAGQLAQSGGSSDLQGVQAVVSQLSSEINTLQAQLRQQEYLQESLTRGAEIARDSRRALETKVEEVTIATASGGRAVVIGGSADPQLAVPPVTQTLLASSAIGLVLGCAVAYLVSRRRDTSRAISKPVTASV